MRPQARGSDRAPVDRRRPRAWADPRHRYDVSGRPNGAEVGAQPAGRRHADLRHAVPRAHKAGQAERRLRSVAWAEPDYVFDRGGGVPMLLLSVSHRFSKCAGAIGLGDVRFHDLRHAYATRLLERGVHRRSSARRLATPRSRSPWTPTATSCRACRRWRPTPSTRYSASRSAATWRQRERFRSSGRGRFRC
jgi:integrase